MPQTIYGSDKPEPTDAEILATPMGPNDANATTVGEYLTKLLLLVWRDTEGFDGKRPFGNSGWPWEIYGALAKAGHITATCDEDGYLDVFDEGRADQFVEHAIRSLTPAA